MSQTPFRPIVCVVDFHHARGPEVETWFKEESTDPAVENDWHLLPFLALCDGAHAFTEDFSYFTLVLKSEPPRSLFGISCTRQLDASQLKNRPKDVTRSAVQKAVVVIMKSPQTFGAVREKLSMVTKAWFAQKDFTDVEILQRFQESLVKNASSEDEVDSSFGLSLREVIHQFKWQTLVLFKCLLLQPKMLFFGSHCEDLCLVQFSLISLVPGLIRYLADCADPSMDEDAKTRTQPTSLRTSERASLLAYMGLPLQLFGKGSLFGPYTPLQQLDMLAAQETKSYVVGSTNALLLQHRDRYADVLVNMDDNSINMFSPSLRTALTLSTADRRWMDFLTQTVQDTWDEKNPSRPRDMGYQGSEEFIRLQFEEYLLALLSSVKYRDYVAKHKDDTRALLSEVDANPTSEFSNEFINSWTTTENYKLFNRTTDSHLFDIIEPRHPCAGGLTMEDVQRRVAQQVQELHLDERWRGSKEALGKHLATGHQRVSSAINTLWADVEVMREAQRKKAEESKAAKAVAGAEDSARSSVDTDKAAVSRVDTNQGLPPTPTTSRAGAYLSSWGAWAAEKRKGWQAAKTETAASAAEPTQPVSEGSKAAAEPEPEAILASKHKPEAEHEPEPEPQHEHEHEHEPESVEPEPERESEASIKDVADAQDAGGPDEHGRE